MYKILINFIAQVDTYTQELSMHNASTVQCTLVYLSRDHFTNFAMSRLREWHLWREPVGEL